MCKKNIKKFFLLKKNKYGLKNGDFWLKKLLKVCIYVLFVKNEMLCPKK